ncbi:MAG: hypothetical protein AAGJ87_09250 [Pseudomonadota bacterium]
MKDVIAFDPETSSALVDTNLSFPQLRGRRMLRRAIADRIWSGLSADHVIVTNSADDALSLLIPACLSKGDKVVPQTPAYPTSAWTQRMSAFGSASESSPKRSLSLTPI